MKGQSFLGGEEKTKSVDGDFSGSCVPIYTPIRCESEACLQFFCHLGEALR